MTNIPRRSLAAGVGLLLGAMAIPARSQQLAISATTLRLTAKPLTFNPDKVKGLSADLLRRHYDEIYVSAVKRMNALNEELAKLDFNEAPTETVAKLKSEELATYNATILHELYFDGIGEAPTQPAGLLAQALSRDFGSLDRWKAEFMATGRSLANDDGWVILAHSPRDKRLYNHRTASTSEMPAGSVPLLAMDMHRHAYEKDDGNDVAKYVEAFMQVVKWTNAERLYREAMRV
jgi:Fe-Mn family superoxide dismutase